MLTTHWLLPTQRLSTAFLITEGSPLHFPMVMLPQFPAGVPMDANTTDVNLPPFGQLRSMAVPSAAQPHCILPFAPAHGIGAGLHSDAPSSHSRRDSGSMLNGITKENSALGNGVVPVFSSTTLNATAGVADEFMSPALYREYANRVALSWGRLSSSTARRVTGYAPEYVSA